MNRYMLIALGTCIIVCNCSCYKMAFNVLGILEDSVSIKKVSGTGKEIAYFPMHHIGKEVFYDDVRQKMDSLKKEGYVVYFEGVQTTKTSDSSTMDTLVRKVRKAMGIDLGALLSNGGYIDTVNNRMFGKKRKSIEKYKLVNQPRAKHMMDTATDKIIDVELSDMVAAFEKEYGIIPLSECDFNTKFGTKYSCKKYKQFKGSTFILAYRDKFLANEVVKDPGKKIAVIYGARHYKGTLSELKRLDPTLKEK